MKLSMERKSIVAVVMISILLVSMIMYFELKRENLTLMIKGEKIETASFKKTVKELLEENNIKFKDEDIIEPSLDAKLEDDMGIKVTEVRTVTETETVKIPFEVKVLDDKNILKGKTKVSKEGQEGEKETKYSLTYHDDVLVEREFIGETITKESVNKVVNKGTKEVVVASRGSSSRSIKTQVSSGQGRHMNVVSTAYSGGGVTATGTSARWGVIAVDPKIIPYGTMVYIPQFNMTFRAEDCGGAIKGNKIDIYMNTTSQAYQWGRRSIDIYIK